MVEIPRFNSHKFPYVRKSYQIGINEYNDEYILLWSLKSSKLEADRLSNLFEKELGFTQVHTLVDTKTNRDKLYSLIVKGLQERYSKVNSEGENPINFNFISFCGQGCIND